MISNCTRLNRILAPISRQLGQLWSSNNDEDGDDNDHYDEDRGLSVEGDNREADKADEICVHLLIIDLMIASLCSHMQLNNAAHIGLCKEVFRTAFWE